MMKKIYKYLFFVLMISCTQTDNNIFDDLSDKGGYVKFDEQPNPLHDILGDDDIVVNTNIIDTNDNAISYQVAIEKEDGTLTDVLATLNTFPSNLTITRAMVLETLGLVEASELPARVRFIGIIKTTDGTFSGQSPDFDATTNTQVGGSTTSGLLAVPSAMVYDIVMYQLVTPNTVTSFFINDANDDAEEIVAQNGEDGIIGTVNLGSSDLELGELSGGEGLMAIGLRFNYIGLPQGANITEAKIQFTVDHSGSGPVEMTIYGENTGNSAPFEETNKNLTKRELTTAKAIWDIPTWESSGDRGEAQRTVDLTAILQEIVNHPDWIPSNSISFIIKPTGVSLNADSTSGGREAETYPESGDNVAELILSYN